MNRQEKENFIADMKERLNKAAATFLVDYKGLDVESMNALRNEIRKHDADFRVVKNRLLNLASSESDSAVIGEHLSGPCAVAIAYEDAVAVAKVLVDQGRDSKHLEVKVGQISGRLIESGDIEKLAALPGREVLLSQVLSAMHAVPTSFVRVLNGVMVNLVNVLKAIEGEKEKSGS